MSPRGLVGGGGLRWCGLSFEGSLPPGSLGLGPLNLGRQLAGDQPRGWAKEYVLRLCTVGGRMDGSLN